MIDLEYFNIEVEVSKEMLGDDHKGMGELFCAKMVCKTYDDVGVDTGMDTVRPLILQIPNILDSRF